MWEFCSDEESIEGQDEVTVRPVDAHEASDEAGLYVFATDVVYADGTVAAGYRYSGNTKEFGNSAVRSDCCGQVSFWLGMLRFVDIEAVKKHSYTKLGRTPAEVFPLTFLTLVPIETVAKEPR